MHFYGCMNIYLIMCRLMNRIITDMNIDACVLLLIYLHCICIIFSFTNSLSLIMHSNSCPDKALLSPFVNFNDVHLFIFEKKGETDGREDTPRG